MRIWEGTDLRLLVLDGSRVLYCLVERLAPEGVQVEHTTSFDQAIEELQNHAPDAVIVNVTPTELPWAHLQALCHEHRPYPIPVLYESSVFLSPQEAGIDELDSHSTFVTNPFHPSDLRRHIHRLLDLAADGEFEAGGEQIETLH